MQNVSGKEIQSIYQQLISNLMASEFSLVYSALRQGRSSLQHLVPPPWYSNLICDEFAQQHNLLPSSWACESRAVLSVHIIAFSCAHQERAHPQLCQQSGMPACMCVCVCVYRCVGLGICGQLLRATCFWPKSVRLHRPKNSIWVATEDLTRLGRTRTRLGKIRVPMLSTSRAPT